MDFPTHVNLSKPIRQELVGLINLQLSRSVDLFTQVKQAHWNLKGRGFIALHELFDQVAKHLRHQSDELAERVATLGGYAEGTARMVAEASDLPEYDVEAQDPDAHLHALVDRLARYCAGLREGVSRCEDPLDDVATADLLTQLLRQSEKDLWFLESNLTGEARTGRGGGREKQKEPRPAH